MSRKALLISSTICAAFCVCLFTLVSLADTLKLKDGSTIEGRVIQQGDRYWVKLADGSTKYIAKDQVVTWTKSSAPGATGAPGAMTPPAVAGAATKAAAAAPAA